MSITIIDYVTFVLLINNHYRRENFFVLVYNYYRREKFILVIDITLSVRVFLFDYFRPSSISINVTDNQHPDESHQGRVLYLFVTQGEAFKSQRVNISLINDIVKKLYRSIKTSLCNDGIFFESFFKVAFFSHFEHLLWW